MYALVLRRVSHSHDDTLCQCIVTMIPKSASNCAQELLPGGTCHSPISMSALCTWYVHIDVYEQVPIASLP